MTPKIKIYVAHRMTGRYQDELVQEAALTTRVLTNFGFEVLDPIIEEKIQSVHEVLGSGTVGPHLLEQYWRRDKEMIRDADLLLDYNTHNKSDGAITEIGYTRFGLWKPVIRILPQGGFAISRLEHDFVTETLVEAVALMVDKFGTYEHLRKWRQAMWDRCFAKWFDEQMKMNKRYGVIIGIQGGVI